MAHTQTLHIIDGSIRSRAAQAQTVFELGYHCEVYADALELIVHSPKNGIVIVRDEDGDGGAAAVLSSLANAGIWLPVIAASNNPEATKVVAAIKAGALDYVALPFEPGTLRATVERIDDEARAYGEARRKMIEARSRISALSPREREVLDWLADGCSNKMIARELQISPRTVEIHRANMMSKIGARHAAEAVRMRIEATMDTALAQTG